MAGDLTGRGTVSTGGASKDKQIEMIPGVGYGNLPLARQVPAAARRRPRFARGTVNHTEGSFDPFTGT